MTQTQNNLFAQVLDHSHITNPYPLYAQLRENPVSLQEDGTYVVSTYAEITALLHDPRVSSDERKRTRKSNLQAAPQQQQDSQQNQEEINPPFIFLDPPRHDILRHQVMDRFTPERVEGLRNQIRHGVHQLLDAQQGRGQIDIVDDFAYPLPVTVICELLGVPREDEGRFHEWADILAGVLDPGNTAGEEEIKHVQVAAKQIREYMINLIANLRAHPGDNLLSGLLASDDATERMSDRDLISTAVLLLIAGHETTVNLVTNSMLTLLRNPDALEQLCQDPDLVYSLVEEVLRYDPPVHFRTRTTLADIDIAGVTIPKGAPLVLLLASGSHDPRRFPNPDSFNPRRPDNQHLGFGGGIHYCVGAPLARIEAHIALQELSRRLVGPRLAVDQPPYRDNAALRGPRHLLVDFESLRD